MGFFGKVAKSWWILISFIPFLNGLGFVYLGVRSHNKNWILEGIIYEIPWIFCIFYQNSIPDICTYGTAIFIWMFSIIRAFWLGILFMKSYDK